MNEETIMNKIFAIILFPIIWISMFIYRIVWFDIIGTLLEIVGSFGLVFVAGPISLLSCLGLIITFPFVLIIEIPIGLIVSFSTAIKMSIAIFSNNIDISAAMKEYFGSLKKN